MNNNVLSLRAELPLRLFTTGIEKNPSTRSVSHSKVLSCVGLF